MSALLGLLLLVAAYLYGIVVARRHYRARIVDAYYEGVESGMRQ